MISTIIQVKRILEKENIDYFITGGSSLFLRKIITDTRDIDFVIKEENKIKIKALFKNELLFIEKKKYICFDKNGFEIEFTLSGKEDKISSQILENKKYELIQKNKETLKIISLKELLSIYRFIYLKEGMEKHLERIKLLDKIIKEKKEKN